MPGTSGPGRFVVGLGGAHGANPLATLHAYLDALGDVPQERLVMAALGPRMLELARHRAAGAFPVLVTPEYIRHARQALGDDTTLAVEQLVVLDTDPQRARAAARVPLGFLGRLPAYQASFRRMGFSEIDIATLGDPLVDAVVAWGDAEAIAARVRELRESGAEHVAVSVVVEGRPPTLDEWRQAADALA